MKLEELIEKHPEKLRKMGKVGAIFCLYHYNICATLEIDDETLEPCGDVDFSTCKFREIDDYVYEKDLVNISNKKINPSAYLQIDDNCCVHVDKICSGYVEDIKQKKAKNKKIIVLGKNDELSYYEERKNKIDIHKFLEKYNIKW